MIPIRPRPGPSIPTLFLSECIMIKRLGIIGELFQFIWDQKLYWMIPMVIILVLVIAISLLGQATAVGPFIYTLF